MTSWLPWSISFDQPAYLWLLLLVPCFWWGATLRRSALGTLRSIGLSALRTAVFAGLILAVADLQLLRESGKLSVLFLLDQSASIPVAQRQAMVDFVIDQVTEHRQANRGDQVGVIVFGKEAQIEIPPIDDDLPLVDRLEGVDRLVVDATNVAAALKLAQATFPEDAAKRIVIVSDGNENVENSLDVASRLGQDGIGIDVVPVQLGAKDDVAVERILLPADVRQNQPFEARVVINREAAADDDQAASPLPGVLRLVRRRSGVEQTIAEQPLELLQGKTVLRFRDQLERPDFYEYQAIFVPADTMTDAIDQNNRSTAFTQLRGKGRVLVIEDLDNRNPDGSGDFDFLVDRLAILGFDVQVRFTDELFATLADLQPYDVVILADAARSGGASAGDVANFSDTQIQALVQNTQQMGCGLIMLGGPNSFGAGGWTNTGLEEVMPVDFQIRNAKVEAVGALVMVMHASEMAQGNHWQKVIAREALKVLGPADYCGVIEWDQNRSVEDWLWGRQAGGIIKVGVNQDRMTTLLGGMQPGDMPHFEPALRLAAAGFSVLSEPAIKHMIIISDGDPTRPQPGGALVALQNLGVRVSTVAVGAHGPPGATPLRNIAKATGGKYYVVRAAAALPRIFQREARRVARPLVVEKGMQPQMAFRHEILRGLESIPPIDGFVMTTVKQNPLVEVPLINPYPADPSNATLLAVWTVGLGRAVAFTSDAGARWASEWTQWADYDKFFGQLVRWCMRPATEKGQIAVCTDVREGKIVVFADVLTETDPGQFSNMMGSVIDPQLESQQLAWRRVSPRRFSAEVDIDQAGSYFVNVRPQVGAAPLRVGVTVPYSTEFRDRETNQALLRSLARLQPRGGQPGEYHDVGLEAAAAAKDMFRHDLPPAVSHQRTWPWLLLLAAGVFVADIFVRKIAVDLAAVTGWVYQQWPRVVPRDAPAESGASLQRLRQRKAEVSDQFTARQAAASFFKEQEEDRSARTAVSEPTPAVEDATAPQPDSPRPEPEDESYTSRLLRAKKETWKQHPPKEDS